MSSAGRQPTDESSSAASDPFHLIYDTVRCSPVPLGGTPQERDSGGQYVTPVCNLLPPELDKHYQNIRHFKEIKPTFKSRRVGKEEGGVSRTEQTRSLLTPLLPSKVKQGSRTTYQNTPRESAKTSGYAELRTTDPSPVIYSASSTALPVPQKKSDPDTSQRPAGSMGNTPTAQQRIKKSRPQIRTNPLVTHQIPGLTDSTATDRSDATVRPSDGDLGVTKHSQFPQPGKARYQLTGYLEKVHTADPVLDRILRRCQTAMEHHAGPASEGRLIFTADPFACGMFDHSGGYLPLPNYKTTLYITPHAIVGDNPEPIFIYVHPDPPTELLDLEKGEEPISSTLVCGKTGLKFSSDVVLSFPVQPLDPSSGSRYHVIVSEQAPSPSERPKHQVLDKILDCFFSVEDNRCTLMVNQLGSFTVISQPPRKTDALKGQLRNQASEEFVSFRVGVFGRQLPGTGSAQIRVIIWKDSDEETQRIVDEENRDRFRKLDRVRAFTISQYRKAVWVTASHVIPGWTLLAKDKERFSVDRLLSQHRKNGCLPSCTFALYREGGSGSAQTPRVVSCTIEISQDGGYGDEPEEDESETVQFVAVVDEESEAPVILPKVPPTPDGCHVPPVVPPRAPITQKAVVVTAFNLLPKPPAGLRHKILGQLSLHLEVSTISGRGWKLLAQKMGLSAPQICCLRERYLCPGEALLNWYLGHQVALVPTREALRRLLELFRDMDWQELETILTREIQNTDNSDLSQEWSNTRPRVYEFIDDEISRAGKRAGDKEIALSSPGLQRKNSYEKLSCRNRMPIPTPRNSPKTTVKSLAESPKAMPDKPDIDRLCKSKSPFDQKLHFTSPCSEKIISPASSPTGFFYQPHLTQLPKPGLWNQAHAHGLSQHTKTHSGVALPTDDEESRTPCPAEELIERFEEESPIKPPPTTAPDEAVSEENPYLQPDVRKEIKPLWRRDQSHSIRLPPKNIHPELTPPTPPRRTTSVRVRSARPPKSLGFQEGEPSPPPLLPTIQDIPAACSPMKHEREPDEYQGPGQMPAAEYSQPPSFLQMKKKVLQDLLKKKFLRAMGIEDENEEGAACRDSISLDVSIPEGIYDDVANLLQEDKDLEMMEEAPGGRQQLLDFLQGSVKNLLSKVPRNATKKKPLPFPSELRSRAATDDMVCYEDIDDADVPMRTTSNRSYRVAESTEPVKRTVFDVKLSPATDDMLCYEDIDEPMVPKRAGVQGSLGAPTKKALPLPTIKTTSHPVIDDRSCYEDLPQPAVPARTEPDKVTVTTHSGEVKLVRKFVPHTRAVPPPPLPEKAYEVMPIGRPGGEQRP
ncbi:uncharacterized protein LOC110975015 [Acanthaster planci]|uniref:Netrin receptor UNC5 n=1 Tax=Acanthaster planci TaxID=133434 RepID=A0A8B7XS21_ACAPL|nr:uncharacterized protein LOC110975015 [Acanthaster planci]